MLARSSVSVGKKLPFIHFYVKMRNSTASLRNSTASLFRGLQPPIPRMRAHGKTCKNNMVVKTCNQKQRA
ncbi:hypothetical protein HpNP133_00610 [Helicobacter pylori]